MADNTTLPATGTGTADVIVATDKIGGVDYQRVKLSVGDDGSAADVKSGGGTEAGSLRVTLASDSTGVLSVDDNGDSLSIDDGGNVISIDDNGDSLTVDNDGTFAVQAEQSGTWTVNPGNTANTTAWKVDASSVAVPVTDNGGALSIDDNGTSITVDGSVAATQSGTWNVGTVATVTNVVHVDDNSGSLSIDDGGNTITVDGTVAVSSIGAADNAIGRVKLTDGTDVADILDLTNSNPLTVAIVDGSGDQITSFGGPGGSGTEYTEGDTDASITGTAIMWEDGSDTLRAVSAAKPLPIGDAGGALTVDNGGTFAVQVDGAALTALQLIDDGVYTDDTSTHATGTSKGYAIMAAATPTDSAVNANDFGVVAMTTDRKLHVSVQDALPAGTNAIGKLAANSGVDIGDVDVTTVGTITPGTAATSLGKAEDAQHASGDVGVMALAVRKATAADLSAGNSDGDYEPLQVDANGRLHVINSAGVAGDVAHDGADSGNPVKIGAKAVNAFPTAVANADRANAISDLFGRLLTAHIDPAQQVHKGVNYTSQQTGATIWDPTAGKKIAITSIVIGTYGTTAGRLILWFGANGDTTYSAGTDQLAFAASFAPSATVKPGAVYTPAVPIYCTTADNELHITTDAALSVDIVIEGYEWA